MPAALYHTRLSSRALHRHRDISRHGHGLLAAAGGGGTGAVVGELGAALYTIMRMRWGECELLDQQAPDGGLRRTHPGHVFPGAGRNHSQCMMSALARVRSSRVEDCGLAACVVWSRGV